VKHRADAEEKKQLAAARAEAKAAAPPPPPKGKLKPSGVRASSRVAELGDERSAAKKPARGKGATATKAAAKPSPRKSAHKGWVEVDSEEEEEEEDEDEEEEEERTNSRSARALEEPSLGAKAQPPSKRSEALKRKPSNERRYEAAYDHPVAKPRFSGPPGKPMRAGAALRPTSSTYFGGKVPKPLSHLPALTAASLAARDEEEEEEEEVGASSGGRPFFFGSCTKCGHCALPLTDRPATAPVRLRVPWTVKEDEALINGFKEYKGRVHNLWVTIKSTPAYGPSLAYRSPVNMKDRYVILHTHGLLEDNVRLGKGGVPIKRAREEEEEEGEGEGAGAPKRLRAAPEPAPAPTPRGLAVPPSGEYTAYLDESEQEF
jgi:hypothetical protein